MSEDNSHTIKKTDYLHFGPDGSLRGVTGVNNEGHFTLFKNLENKNHLSMDDNNLYYTGNKICLDDVCLGKDALHRISNFFNIKLSKRISDNFYKENEEVLNKEPKLINDIIKICKKMLEFYNNLSSDEKKMFIRDAFHNKIRLPKLGLVVDQANKIYNLMNMLKQSDINIARTEYKVDKLSELDIDVIGPYYEIKLSENEIPTRLIIYFDNNIVKFSFIDYYILLDLEHHYFNIYRSKSITAINQIDSISIFNLKPHDLKILVDNLKSITLTDGLYDDKVYLKTLCIKDVGIDIHKLDALLYFPNHFMIKEFDIGEYESMRENIDSYLIGSLISKYIYLGNIDSYEVRLLKGEKNEKLSSKWKINFKKL